MTIKMRRRKFTGPSDSLDLAVTAAYILFGDPFSDDDDWDEDEDDEWGWDSPTVETVSEFEIFTAEKFTTKKRRAIPQPQGIFVRCDNDDRLRVRIQHWDFKPVMWESYDDGKSE
jgi:hypothetical protein